MSFVLIGFTSFGGMSMIPLINQEMISHGWMTLQEVSDIVAIAEMTPGPLGLNCATFAGTRVAGALGALCACAGVMLPTLTLTLVAAIFFDKFKNGRLMQQALYGIRPICIGMILAIVIELAMSNYAGSVLGVSPSAIAIGIVSFVMLYVFRWSVPKTIMLAATLGLALGSIFAL